MFNSIGSSRLSLSISVLFFALQASALTSGDIQSDITQSIQVHSQAQDFHDWADSAHTPEKLFSKWIREPNPQRVAKWVCASLAKLNDSELALFQDAVENHPFAPHLRCQSSVLSKVLSFFDSARDSIVDRLPSLPLVVGRDGRPSQPGALGPSLEMDIDADGGPVYFNADLDKKYVAFTFDDGPHSRNTPELLGILAQEKVQATFFMVGNNVKSHPQIVKDIAAAGHSVGNHTWSHKNLHKTGLDGGIQEIMDGFQAIWDVLGYSHPYFRFPFGNRTEDLQGFVKANHFGTFFWNI
ncbi:MAG: polysaccharide deacetylase family protein, partial [Bdellovibrionales bacterium]|nr:polysaccharide deacetylase family protein [Bdellovibrionales bacterium]